MSTATDTPTPDGEAPVASPPDHEIDANDTVETSETVETVPTDGGAVAPLDVRSGHRRPRGPWASAVRSSTFVRKELVEILRQPKLLALLVLGPFLLLMLFGAGYSQSDFALRAIFVSPDPMYEEVVEGYGENFGDLLISEGFAANEHEARRMLAADEVDVVVVFPADPMDSVADGERALIRVIHDKIDPLKQTAIQVATRIAVQEVNATIVAEVAEQGRDELLEAQGAISGVIAQLEADDASSTTREDADRASAFVDASVETLGSIDTAVLVRPFDSVTETTVRERISPNDYFTPGALALLLQHLGVTFAALSLVRDRSTGLFELLRVGPLSPTAIVVGKSTAYLVLGGVVASALLGASVLLLDVPMVGSIGWLALVLAMVILSSLALGMLLSMLSATESQAVQFAMLTLLAGLFFSGFALSLDDMQFPVTLVSWLLPVTYGIRTLQDVMFRGVAPDTTDLVGLAALVLVYGSVAVVALRRKLRVG